MTSFPLIEALAAAADNRDRAGILLALPDAQLLGSAEMLRQGCRRAAFEEGADFVDCRVAVAHAVRDASGLLPAELAIHAERFRAAMARYAAGPPG